MSSNTGKGLDAIMLLAIAGGLYVLYQLVKEVPAGAAAITGAIANNPLTEGASSAIAGVIEGLTFGAPIEVNGTAVDSNGNVLGPISSFPAATGSDGNTYLEIGGAIYELTGSNQNGTYVASLIEAQASGGTYPSSSEFSAPAGGTGSTGLTPGATSFFSP